jgi:hypothetical protein
LCGGDGERFLLGGRYGWEGFLLRWGCRGFSGSCAGDGSFADGCGGGFLWERGWHWFLGADGLGDHFGWCEWGVFERV